MKIIALIIYTLPDYLIPLSSAYFGALLGVFMPLKLIPSLIFWASLGCYFLVILSLSSILTLRQSYPLVRTGNPTQVEDFLSNMIPWRAVMLLLGGIGMLLLIFFVPNQLGQSLPKVTNEIQEKKPPLPPEDLRVKKLSSQRIYLGAVDWKRARDSNVERYEIQRFRDEKLLEKYNVAKDITSVNMYFESPGTYEVAIRSFDKYGNASSTISQKVVIKPSKEKWRCVKVN